MSKREIQEKELKTILGKDVATKNPVFSPEHITELQLIQDKEELMLRIFS